MTIESRVQPIPTTRLGNIDFPRLVMGLHPYDGVSYQDTERDAENLEAFGRVSPVADVLRHAVENFGFSVTQVDHMIPELNRLHLQAIWETERLLNTEIGLLAYILIPISMNGEVVSYTERAHSTLYGYDLAAVGEEAYLAQVAKDEILRYTVGGDLKNLVTPKTVEPYSRTEAENFSIDYSVLEQYLGFFAGCNILVADPGAEIDLLAAVGRFDLVREYMAFLRTRFDTIISSVHHAGITIPLLEENNIDVDGYIVPVNQPGMYMFPTQERVIDAVRQTSKPVICIKPMAGGRYLGAKAFEFVLNEVGVDSCMFGMGSIEQVTETATAARSVLGLTSQ
ncbi:MAG: hypothetical protein QF357_05620 [Dehalococcoidia bacterium]|jgi:hypothetical protein|nr:hypothetical protein [Dehalococcoidia bacterium]